MRRARILLQISGSFRIERWRIITSHIIFALTHVAAYSVDEEAKVQQATWLLLAITSKLYDRRSGSFIQHDNNRPYAPRTLIIHCDADDVQNQHKAPEKRLGHGKTDE